MSNTPQVNGILFEKEVHQSLKSTNYTILSERDIRNKYGSNISGIDHLINTEEYIICIQKSGMGTERAEHARITCECVCEREREGETHRWPGPLPACTSRQPLLCSAFCFWRCERSQPSPASPL